MHHPVRHNTDEDEPYDSRERNGKAPELRNAADLRLNTGDVHRQCKTSLCTDTVESSSSAHLVVQEDDMDIEGAC